MRSVRRLLLLLFAPLSLFVCPTQTFVPNEVNRLRMNGLLRMSSGEFISIEYCTGCRWMLRSAWIAQELLSSFTEDISSVTLIPVRSPAPGGIFRIRRNKNIIWDRKQEGGFPEARALKQRLGNIILGRGERDYMMVGDDVSIQDCETCPDPPELISWDIPESIKEDTLSPMPNVAITYCVESEWMLQSAWFAQELLSTFDQELNSVTLCPSLSMKETFVVELDGELMWDRSKEGRFPEPKELKQLIRNVLDPNKDLGHSDVAKKQSETELPSQPFDDMSEDDAAEMRQYFGVM